MSYGRDRDSYTRGSGAIAAADANNPRRARERQARLVRSELRDNQLAGLTFGARGGIAGLGAISTAGTVTGLTGGMRRPVLEKGGGSIEGGGSGKGGYGSGYGRPLDNAGRLPPKNPPPPRPKTPLPPIIGPYAQLYVPPIRSMPPPSNGAPCAWGKTAAACALPPPGPDPRDPVRPNGSLPPAGGGKGGDYGLDPKPPNTSGSKVGRPRPWGKSPPPAPQPQVVVVSVPGGGGTMVVKPGGQVVVPTTTPPMVMTPLVDPAAAPASSSRNWLLIAAAVAGAYLLLRDKKGTAP